MTKTTTKAKAAAKESAPPPAHRARLRREPQTAGGAISGQGCRPYSRGFRFALTGMAQGIELA